MQESPKAPLLKQHSAFWVEKGGINHVNRLMCLACLSALGARECWHLASAVPATCNLGDVCSAEDRVLGKDASDCAHKSSVCQKVLALCEGSA